MKVNELIKQLQQLSKDGYGNKDIVVWHRVMRRCYDIKLTQVMGPLPEEEFIGIEV